MRQQKNHSRIICLGLIFLFIVLNIPKTYQLNNLLQTMLSQDEMNFFMSYRSFFVLMALILELIGATLNVFILKYVYHFAKLEISMIQNINIYLSIACITKFISIFIPKAIMSAAPFINSLLFSCFYILFHYLHQQDHSKRKWTILMSYPLVNLIFSIL